MKYPKISIIVPVGNAFRSRQHKTLKKDLEECIDHCLKLNYSNYEIIVLPDHEIKIKKPRVKFYPTGKLPPSAKRDIGSEIAKGELLAFIDDDAYPRKDWLKNTVKYFKNKDVGAVGGPGITPDSDNDLQKASGYVYSSCFGASPSMRYRYIPTKKKEIDDYPTCNLIVRKDIFKKVGGFDTKYWPGEDTKFCLDLTKKLKKKMIYAPDVVVYHHRRPLFKKHLDQIRSYGTHRGFFAKRFPETSSRPIYFLPSFFVLFLVFGWLSFFIYRYLFYLYLFGVALYLFLVLLGSLSARRIKLVILTFFGIITTHIWYGISFMKGFLSKDLKK
ncbi:MAG: glycosyltransferase [Candidatus Aenigmarchaeota archaeon]|nr:glycosyltransferase [Candidatus Aenigmarchaeota archaeon]